MAQKSLKERKSNDELEELLDQLGKLLDRTKIMYEQYFMGIQKMPPQQLHRDIERRIRELTREHIRNTGLRYRLTNLKQKFGSYNSYWRRIMREIERGTYIRDVARAGRKAARRGDDIAPEVLAAMPKRMRKRILRDRDMARAKADRDDRARARQERGSVSKGRTPGNVHRIDENADDLDLDALFDSITSEGPGTLADSGGPAGATPESADAAPAGAPQAGPPGKVAPPRPQAGPPGKVVPPRPQAGPPGKPPPPPGTPPGNRSAPPGTPPGKRPAPPSKPVVPRAAAGRKPPPRPGRAGAARRGNGEAPPPGMSSGQAKQLYDQYVKAKRLVGEKTDNISYKGLMRSLNKQAPGIMTKHKARGVEFGVVIKNEKVVLKAKPKK